MNKTLQTILIILGVLFSSILVGVFLGVFLLMYL